MTSTRCGTKAKLGVSEPSLPALPHIDLPSKRRDLGPKLLHLAWKLDPEPLLVRSSPVIMVLEKLNAGRPLEMLPD